MASSSPDSQPDSSPDSQPDSQPNSSSPTPSWRRDERCGSVGAGHHAHWIQAKLNFREDRRPATITAITDDGTIHLHVNGEPATCWTHDPARLRRLVDEHGSAVEVGAHSALLVPNDLGFAIVSVSETPTGCTAGSDQPVTRNILLVDRLADDEADADEAG